MSDAIADRVIAVVAGHFTARRPIGAPVVSPATHLFDDLNADSLDVIELAMELEERFDIELPDSALEGGGHTVGDFVKLVQERVQA
jgi:acyl carrier protein